MEYKDIVAISGLGGLFEVVAKREDGMIVRGLEEDKPHFVASRQHVFSPLETITIYTTKDTEDLLNVLLEMKKQSKENPPVDLKADNKAFKDYFKKVLPEYDEERVYVSDIKKVIKWYAVLDKFDLIKKPKPKEETETEKPAHEVKKAVPEATKKVAVKEKPSKASSRKVEVRKAGGPRKTG